MLECYQEFKSREEQIKVKLLADRAVEDFTVHSLIESCVSRCKDVEPAERACLLALVQESRRFRLKVLKEYRTKEAWGAHVVFLAFHSVLEAELRREEAALHSVPSEMTELWTYLVEVGGQASHNISRVGLAKLVKVRINQESGKKGRRIVRKILRLISTMFSGPRSDVDHFLLGSLAIVLDQEPAEKLEMNLVPEPLGLGDVDTTLDGITADKLDQIAFWSEMDGLIKVIMDFWHQVTDVPSLVAAALGTEYVWRDLSAQVHALDLIQGLNTREVPETSLLTKELQVVRTRIEDIPDLTPPMIMNWVILNQCRVATFKCGLKNEFADLRGIFARSFIEYNQHILIGELGLALTLKIEKEIAGPSFQDLQALVRQQAWYIDFLVQAVIEETPQPRLPDPLPTILSRDLGLQQLGIILAWYLARSLHCILVLISQPRFVALAHIWWFNILRRGNTLTTQERRFRDFLELRHKTIFHDGFPESVDACITPFEVFARIRGGTQAIDTDQKRRALANILTVAKRRDTTEWEHLLARILLNNYDILEIDGCDDARAHVENLHRLREVLASLLTGTPDVLHLQQSLTDETRTCFIKGVPLANLCPSAPKIDAVIAQFQSDLLPSEQFNKTHCWCCGKEFHKEPDLVTCGACGLHLHARCRPEHKAKLMCHSPEPSHLPTAPIVPDLRVLIMDIYHMISWLESGREHAARE